MLQPTKLTCEYQVNPLGIDVKSPRFAWQFCGDEALQAAYQIVIVSASDIVAWDSGKVTAAQSSHVVYAGEALRSFEDYRWKVTIWDENGAVGIADAFFSTGCYAANLWQARWVGKQCNSPFALQYKFVLDTIPIRPKLYASALGVYHVKINGRPLDQSCFNPGWTDYNKRIQYQAFDLSGFLKRGENQIEVLVADGWYCGNIAIAGREMYGTYPLYFFGQIMSGEQLLLASDHTWEASAGALISSDLQSGEVWDYRIPYHWEPVDVARDDLTERLCAQKGARVEKRDTRSPKLISDDGEKQIFDFEQNMVGWISVQALGARGQKIVLRHGEMLHPDGSLYVENLRTAKQVDQYTLAEGNEVCEPLFTYHGFRYIEVSGITLLPKQITAVCLYAGLEETIEFSCSNPMVNKLWQNVIWGQRGNFFSVPTDCPQRDERMGWTGDAQVFCKTACYNMDSAAYYEKYLQDLFDAQRDDGAVTDVVPDVALPDGRPLVGAGTAAWGDAAFILPYTLYEMYGDRRALEEHYAGMERYFEYLLSTADNYIRPAAGYGDWLSVGEDTPRDLLATAYFAYAAYLMSEIAVVLGRDSDTKRYWDYYMKIKEAFCAAYLTEGGVLQGDTQTSYLLALKFKLLPQEYIEKAVENLVKNIKRHDEHLTTGFVGVSYLLPVLSDYGEGDLAYRLLQKESYPSWLYSVKNGATTIWERWNSYTIQDGFGDIAMNSFNHYSLGSVAEWLYGYAAGIRLAHDKEGKQQIAIAPHMQEMGYMTVTYHSIYGAIVVHWDEVVLRIEIPAGQTATALLPDETERVLHSGVHSFRRK